MDWFLYDNASVLKGLKTTDDHEEFISINEIDKIINNLDWILKVLIESTINWLNILNLALSSFYTFFSICASASVSTLPTEKLKK